MDAEHTNTERLILLKFSQVKQIICTKVYMLNVKQIICTNFHIFQLKNFQSSTSNFADGKRPSLKPSHFVGQHSFSWDLRTSLWSWLIKITFSRRFEGLSISFIAKKRHFFRSKIISIFVVFCAVWLLVTQCRNSRQPNGHLSKQTAGTFKSRRKEIFELHNHHYAYVQQIG